MLTRDDFEYRGPSMSKRDLAALEKRLGLRLPDDYREFLLTINGGRPRTHEVFDIGKKDSSLLDILYSAKRDDEHQDLTVFRRHRLLEKRVPRDLLPIGEDQGNSQICLGIGEENYGKVFFWDLEDEREQPTYENVALIADSFAEFLDSLYSDEGE